MKKKITSVNFTKRANQDFDKMYEELNQHSPKAAGDFIKDFDKVINLVQQQPDMFEESQKIKGVRRGLFYKQRAFLYRVFKKSIRIVSFYHQKQDK